MTTLKQTLLCLLSLVVGCSGAIGDPAASTPTPGGPDRDAGTSGPTACTDERFPVSPRLQRLSFAQYDRTVSELLGTPVTPSTELGPQVDEITPDLLNGLESAAEGLAARTTGDPAALARILPCAPTGDGTACARQMITALGRRAYRRSLTEPELTRLLALFTDRALLTPRGTFEDGIGLMLEAVLQSPYFLVRSEISEISEGAAAGRVRLSGSEMASRLSYALWNGPPDEALLAAAAGGVLDTTDGVRAQATRMLTEPAGVTRARQMVRASTRDWLGMEGAYAQFWSNTQRDPALYPAFYAGIDADFREDVLRFADHVIFDEQGSFRDLFTSPTAVVNARLAPIYEVTGTFTDWTPVQLDPDLRPGLLTRAGFVGTHGRFSRGSLIFRGAFVLKRIFCQELGSPPAGAEDTPLPAVGTNLVTTRQRVEAITAAPQCATCHTHRINPAGFAFESYDAIGRYRTTDNGAPVDPRGSIQVGGKLETYDSPKAYAEILAASREAQRCYVSRFAQFTFADAGVELGCDTQRLADRLGEDGATVRDFLIDFVSSDAFVMRSTVEVP